MSAFFAEIIGTAMILATHAQWNTGLLIHKRSKKPLRFDELMKITGFNKDKLSSCLKNMTTAGILQKDEGSYKLSFDFIKKGGAMKCETTTNGNPPTNAG